MRGLHLFTEIFVKGNDRFMALHWWGVGEEILTTVGGSTDMRERAWTYGMMGTFFRSGFAWRDLAWFFFGRRCVLRLRRVKGICVCLEWFFVLRSMGCIDIR